MFEPNCINASAVVKQMLCISNLPGLQHLWFIRNILLCYLITPILQFVSNKSTLLAQMLFFAAVAVLFQLTMGTGAWNNCYIVGFALAKIKSHNERLFFCTKVSVYILAAVLNGVKIYIKYFLGLSTESNLGLQIMAQYSHVFLGTALFLLLLESFSGQPKLYEKKGLITILRLSDDLSYQVYLTHHLFILSSLSPLQWMRWEYSILLTLLLIILSTVFLKWIVYVLQYAWKRIVGKKANV